MPLSEALHEAPGSLGTVRNAVLLLQLLGEGPAYQQLTDLAERSGLSLPTVHRLLRSLVLADLVEQDPRSSRYGLGPELARLANRYLARLPVAGALAPYLAQLRDETGATVRIALLVHGSAVVVDRVDGPTVGLYREPHGAHPALLGAGGRLLVARADDEMWKQALADVDDELAILAEGQRETWAAAATLVLSAGATGLVEVAVVVPGGLGGAGPTGSAALVLELPGDPDPPAVEAATAALVRAATAAVRTLGQG